MTPLDPADKARAIAEKWVARLGRGFHPDRRGRDYEFVNDGRQCLSDREERDYDASMEELFTVASDPYAVGLEAMRRAGLVA